MFLKLWDVLKGKKTFIVSFCMLAFSLIGMATGWLDQVNGIELVLQALGLSALRLGVGK